MHTSIPGSAFSRPAALMAMVLSLAGCGHAAPSVTEVVYETAVDSEGQPGGGYRERSPEDDPATNVATVSYCAASPAAVDADIYQCWPAAAGADVCWPSTPDSLLCLDDPWDKRLHRVAVKKPRLHVQPTATPQPFALQLDDGTRCRLRTGGAWGGRDDGYLGAYGCADSPVAVLAKPERDAIDRTEAMWTVKVGELGAGDIHVPPPETRAVTTAWFAGTSS